MFAQGVSVQKVSGERDVGKRGRIEHVMTNAKGETILSVSTVELYGNRHAMIGKGYAGGSTATSTVRTKSWLASECEVINEHETW